MTDKPKKKTAEDITSEMAYWQNELDAKKYLIKVHNNEFSKVMGEDFKLAKLDEGGMSQKQQFVMDMVGIGQMALDIVPDPEVAYLIKEMDFMYINTLAVLNFNLQNNMIVDRVTNWKQDEDKETDIEDSGWIEKMSKRLSGKSKPKEPPENDD